jgi:hypothetical protein
MAMKTGEENEEPMDLRKDLLGQLAGPIVFLVHATKPYTSPACEEPLFAIAVRDAAVLDKTLARLHGRLTGTMPAEQKKDLNQDLLGTHIYIFPGPNPMQMAMGVRPEPGEKPNPMAFAVAGQQLVIGGLSLVQQNIRDAKNDKAKPENILADSLCDYAMKFVPAQAGAVFYANQQIGAEILWAQIKSAAADAAKAPAGRADATKIPALKSFMAPIDPDDGDDDMPPMGGPGMGLSGLMGAASSGNPMAVVVQMLKGYCDFTALPDFAAVRGYFGAQVTHVVSTDDGILIESRDLKPPAKR